MHAHKPGTWISALVLLLLAGCTTNPAGDSTGQPPGDSLPTGDGGGVPDPSMGDAPAPGGTVDAPDLPLGRAWTFRANGYYDVEPEFTVVVAKRTDDGGYFLAAGAPEHLIGEVTWGRGWFGERTADLRLPGSDYGAYFDFPLYDGKTWQFSEGVYVVATAAEVPGASGGEPGFVMEAQLENGRMQWTYAPSVGFFTAFQSQRNGHAYFELALTGMSAVDEYVWYERLTRSSVFSDGDAQEPATVFTPPAEADAIVVAGGGTTGARGHVIPAQGSQPWSFEAAGPEMWTGEVLPNVEGPWELVVVPPVEGGFSYLDATAVRWIRERIMP